MVISAQAMSLLSQKGKCGGYATKVTSLTRASAIGIQTGQDVGIAAIEMYSLVSMIWKPPTHIWPMSLTSS
jgi:hypothetical protein